ncbi:MAG: hypothetical protein F6K54_31275 [Okeania sp. SIO3B5]|uniref:LamG domain-containing protein n=1 Tax=Okeania sp. SIO3B5 TaxID=2607811 RepID=UPI001401ABA6|nr:LamG domain-containing protein [Okeania sp. SIO3B5]NEO57162.1 hypothetical protein [Okeania sp. SIO3B5]
MSEIATKNLTFWDTTNYKYPGFGQTAQISDGLGGTIGITYNQIDYDNRSWKGKPDGGTPITEARLLSGEIENQFTLTGQVKGITATMPQIRTIGRENNYSVTLDFSNYKASLAGSKVTDGATCGDTYLAISRFFNGSKAGYTTIKVTATTLDGSPVNLTDWKLFNSGTLGKGHNARIFLDAATQTISGKNSQGKQEFCPTPPNPGTSFGTDTGLGLFQLPSDQRYTSITLTFKQKKIKGAIPNDLHDIYVASNTSSTSPISETPETKPMDINSGLQLHLPLNEIVENAAKEKEVVDISGNKFNGKVHGAAIVTDSRFGNCINFDGVDDYIDLPKETIPQTGAITISFWAYGGKSLPKNTVLISAYNKGNQPLLRVYLPWSDRRIIFDYGNPFDRLEKVGEAADFKDKWTYWTFTKNVAKGEMNIYLNGTLWHSSTGKDKAIDSVVKVMFGRETYNSYYNGQIAHLRIYDRVLSLEDINECMKVDGTPPPMDINSGLQLHLPLNEIVENAAKEKEVVDISAGKLNGKVYGATVVAEPRFGNCLNFNGNHDYVIINPMPNFPSEAMTVLCWVRSNNQSKEGTVLSYAKSSAQRYNEFQIYNIKNITPTVNNKWHSTGVAFNDGEWHCVAITWQSSDGQLKVYKDGKEVHSKVISKGNPIATGGALVLAQEQDKLGGGFAGNQAFQGQMAHLRMYNRVLSPEDINECMKVDGTPPPMDINRGLQFHLPLNEIVENSAKEKEVVDVSPAKLKGKVNGEPTVVVDSKLGNCLNFDGVDDYIQMPAMNIDYSQGLTVEAWIHYNSFKHWSRIIDFGNGTPNNNIVFANETTTSNLCFDSFKGTTSNRVQANGKLELNKWLHLAVTVDGSGNTKIYKNGAEEKSGLINLPNNTNRTKNYIGKSNWSTDGYFQGKMSHLRMYNRALSPEEINECMKVDETPPPMDINRGLQLHLPLNEIVENAAKEKEVVDVSPAKLKGKVNGEPTVVVDSKLGNCLNFDGVDDYIQMPAMNIDYSQGFTVEAWVHYNSFKNWSRIIDFGNDAGSDNILFANPGTTANLTLHNYLGATNHPIDADGTLEQTKWLYLAATIDESGNGKIYKNGQEVGSGTSSIPNNVNRTKNYIAKSNWSADAFFHGKMSHLRMYNRALSPEEINECMKIDGTPPMDINRGLQLHLPLNEIVENAAKEKEVVDVSTSKLNGKVNGAKVVADSNFGNCLSFDGVDDYIQMPEMNIDYSQGFTVEAWVYYQNFKIQSRVIDFANSPGKNNIIFGNSQTTNSVLLVVFVGSTRKAIEVKGILEKNQWLHLTATIDKSGNAKVYKDGQEVGGGLVAIPNSVNRTKNYIGKSNWSADGYFQGKMSHLRMYNRALSKEEINECMKVDATPPPMDINRGLQLHLPLNEIVENAAKEKEVVDVSTSKLNGKVNGATVVADDRFGNCINFDGVDDYIELSATTIPQTGEITISFWANGGKSLPKGCSIISGRDQSNQVIVNIELPWSESMINFDCGRKDDSCDRVKKIAETVDFKDQWRNWVFTKNVATGEMQIYQDGVLWQNATAKNKPINSVTQVKFGTGYGFYDGKVAHLRIYDRVLSPEEIDELMTVDEVDEADTTSTTDETDTTDGTDTTSTTDETDTTDGTDTTSTTDETDTTDGTDTTSTTDETDTTDGTDTTSTTDETDTTGETGSTSTTDETDTTGETDSTSTTDETDTTGETDSTSTTDETPKPIDIDSGLHLNLPLNEIVENSAKEKEVVDASGGKLNGKVYGAKVIDDPNFGNCIGFDGVDDYIELPPTAIPETNEITISFWANGGESLPKQSSILLAQDKTNHRVVNIHLPWSDSNVCFDCGNKTSSFDRIEQLAQISDFKGKWNHWAFTKNVATGEMKIYLNGSLWQTVTDKDQELSQITQIKLGCGYGFYEGKVADLRIYNRVLSQEEINELMKVNQPATTSTTDETDTTSTTDETDTTQKPMEYRIYQVKGNPTIETGYQESEWTAVIAGFNSGANQKHRASALTIMPVVEHGEWKIKCDIKDADDRYWDVAVLFIRNNMVNRVNNFYR